MYTGKRYFILLVSFLTLLILHTNLSFALDPKFELGADTLRPETSQPALRKHADKRDAAAASRGGKKSGVTGSNPRQTNVRALKVRTAKIRAKSKAAKRRKTHVSKEAGTITDYHKLRMTVYPGINSNPLSEITVKWSRLVSPAAEITEPFRISGLNYSLSLDSSRYPVLPAADGGKIIIDTEGTLPAFVKEILRESGPGIRVVSERPYNRKKFIADILSAARFYSIEENFALHFGSDPKVTVTSDFMIEKTEQSLTNNDVVLLNVTPKNVGLPLPIVSHLEKEGFHIIDLPSASRDQNKNAVRHVLYRINDRNQQGIVDSLLSAFSVNAVHDKEIELDDGLSSGISLTVRAVRFVETSGMRIAISFGEENPVQYTLFKLLQLKGYQVVNIRVSDNFQKTTEKVLNALRIQGAYGMHHLGRPGETAMDVQLTGFLVKKSGNKGGDSFFTNVEIDSLAREAADFKGYTVLEK
jgi:hypothetical protein